MNWSRILIAGVVAGIARAVYEFILHAVVMSSTYAGYPEVFDQQGGGEFWFPILSILIATVMAYLYARTQKSWGSGVMGGVSFGFCLGWIFFFLPFYSSLVVLGFPYYLSWFWGGIDLIGSVVTGAVIGALHKS